MKSTGKKIQKTSKRLPCNETAPAPTGRGLAGFVAPTAPPRPAVQSSSLDHGVPRTPLSVCGVLGWWQGQKPTGRW